MKGRLPRSLQAKKKKKKNTDHELVIQILCLFVMGGTAMTFCLSIERDNSLWTPIRESKALEIK